MGNRVALTVLADGAFCENLKLAKSAGFKYINVGFGRFWQLLTEKNWQQTAETILNALESNGLKAINTHAPYYDLRLSSEIQDENLNEAQMLCLKVSKILGESVCAFHPRTRFTGGENSDVAYLDNIKNFAPLVNEAKKQGVAIGIENLPKFPEWDPVFYSCYVSDQLRLIDYFGDPSAVCAVWDTGHANLMKEEQSESIKTLGTRIKATHIHNNFKDDDMHFAPSVGNIDWAAVAKAFKQAGYRGYFTSESNLLSGDLGGEYIKHIYDCLIKIEKLFNEA